MSIRETTERGQWGIVTCDYCLAKQEITTSPMMGGEIPMRALDIEDNQEPTHICGRCEDRAIDHARRQAP